jgi:mono/diheme cytochrome c family protein
MTLVRSIRRLAAAICATLALASCNRPSDLPPDFEARVASDSARRNGAVLYLRYCALCHGERGDGRGLRSSAFATPPRDFTNATWRRSTSPARVFRAIRDGVPGTPMAAWRHLGDDRLIELTACVLAQSSSTRNDSPARPLPDMADAARPARGRRE